MAEINEEKLRKQLAKAHKILRAEKKVWQGHSVTAGHVKKIISRTEKLLGIGKGTKGKASPKKKDKSVGEKARSWFEKKLPGDAGSKLKEVKEKTRKTATLIGVAKRANRG